MLTKAFPFLDPRRITPELATRLQMLADDCVRLAHDTAFVADRLTTAPVLDLYVPLVTPVGLHLVGQVTGHPRLGSRTIVTSQLWFADPGGMWANKQVCALTPIPVSAHYPNDTSKERRYR